MTSVVTVSASKPTQRSKVGISLRNAADGGVFVSVMNENSIFASTLLSVGMKVDEINGIKCHDLNSATAADILRQATAGIITIKAHVSTTTTTLTQTSTIVTATLVEDYGPATSTTMALPPTTSSQTDIAIAQAEPAMGMQHQPSAPPLSTQSHPAHNTGRGVCATITKPTRDTVVGIVFRQGEDGVYVKELKHYGLFLSTPLDIGMKVDSINGTSCAGLTSIQLATMMREAEGEVSVKAHHPSSGQSSNSGVETNALSLPSGPHVICVTITKPTRDTAVGIIFRQHDDGVYVKELKHYSLFLSTPLEVGMTMESVNGVSCARMNSKQVADLMREAEGEVIVKAYARGSGRGSKGRSTVNVFPNIVDPGVGVDCNCDCVIS